MPPHCVRSASDPRTRPFFPLSATKALRTTALMLVSARFWFSDGCPGSFQASSDVEENCLTPQLLSAVIKLALEVKLYASSVFSPCGGDVHAVRSRCPVHALDFHHFGKPREGKVRFVCVLQSPSLPLPLKSRVCRCLQSVPSP